MAREGNLEAPTRHPLAWTEANFWDETRLESELERVFNICHGCRRCVSLCNAFPTLFDLIDNSSTLEIDGVAKTDYAKVVEHCYLCDLCYQTKCPYVPPHQWNVDFPHLMLRAKAVHFKRHGVPLKAKILSSTTTVGRMASIPVVAEVVNAVNASGVGRKLLDKTLGVHPDAMVPAYHSRTARKRLRHAKAEGTATPAGRTHGKVAIFATCYCDVSLPQVVDDLHAVLIHNGIPTRMVMQEVCCGMPKLELGDLDSVRAYKEKEYPGAGCTGTRGIRFAGADSVLRADVQAGTAADVSRRRRRAAGEAALLRSVRVPDATPAGRPAENRFQEHAEHDRLAGRLPPARAEHRP
ncbi:protein of unknown function cysteine-rich region domain protein, partial [mine drainage metagenome]